MDDNTITALKLLIRLRWKGAFRKVMNNGFGAFHGITEDGVMVDKLIEKMLKEGGKPFEKELWKQFDQTKGFADLFKD